VATGNSAYGAQSTNPSRARPAENPPRRSVLSGLGALVTTPLRSVVTRAGLALGRCSAQRYPLLGWTCARQEPDHQAAGLGSERLDTRTPGAGGPAEWSAPGFSIYTQI